MKIYSRVAMEDHIDAVTLYGGTDINAWAQPYRFFLLQRVQDEFAQQAAHTLLTKCDMAEVLETKLSRQIGRIDNLEVWA